MLQAFNTAKAVAAANQSARLMSDGHSRAANEMVPPLRPSLNLQRATTPMLGVIMIGDNIPNNQPRMGACADSSACSWLDLIEIR